MGRITFTADEQHEGIIAEVEGEDGIDSQAAAVRACIERYADLQQRVDDLQQELDDLRTELERVRTEKRLILDEREEKAELARYVERERTVQERWRSAGLIQRTKWRVFGMDDAES